MLATVLGLNPEKKHDIPKEGELFKIIQLFGKTFEIRYGFYEERDRHTPYAEPIAIYPDFAKEPLHTDDGTPFVTEMQSPCNCFNGKMDVNSVCGDCSHYRRGDELLGTCTCPKNKKEITDEAQK